MLRSRFQFLMIIASAFVMLTNGHALLFMSELETAAHVAAFSDTVDESAAHQGEHDEHDHHHQHHEHQHDEEGPVHSHTTFGPALLAQLLCSDSGMQLPSFSSFLPLVPREGVKALPEDLTSQFAASSELRPPIA
jgi:hypothetical protein